MATAQQTVTIDTASSPWVYSDGQNTTINGTSQTLVFAVNDLGDTVQWLPGTTALSLTMDDGNIVQIFADPAISRSKTLTNATAVKNAWSWFCSVNNGLREEVKVTSMQATDVDGNNTDLTLTFEYPGKPWQWTWSSINTTAA